MNIREACASILGAELAGDIIADMGIHWAVVTAMTEAKKSADPAALAAINLFNAEQKKQRASQRSGVKHL